MKINRRTPESLLFELSGPGKTGMQLPAPGVKAPHPREGWGL